jgi:hypothetical protein
MRDSTGSLRSRLRKMHYQHLGLILSLRKA